MLAALWCAGLALASTAGDLPVWVLGAYGATSLVTFVAYWRDKRAAVARRWRTPESTLLLLGLVGGWPGAVVAQETLRHKTVKRSFQTASMILDILKTLSAPQSTHGYGR